MKTLRPYQQEANDKFHGKQGAFFAMEMRLGKTLASIRWILGEVDSGLIVVAAPLAVLISWKDELESERQDYFDFTLIATKDKQTVWDTLKNTDKIIFCLFNYESLRNQEVLLVEAAGWLCDESTVLKNAKSTITKTFLCATKDFCGPRACLSGLPAPQCISELWSQMAIINGGSWMSFKNFYSFTNTMGYEIQNQLYFSKQKKKKIKEQFHKDAFVLTREQAGIQEQWITIKRSQPLHPKAQKVYDHILKEWSIPGIDDQEDNETKYAIVINNWLRRLCGGFLPDQELPCWKYKDLKHLLSTELRNESVVVWCAFNSELEKLREELGIPILYGGTNRDERVRLQKSFQRGQIRVIAVQIALGKFGIRLDRADVAVYFSNAFSCEKKQQSKDRIVDVEKLKRGSKALLRIEYVTQDTVEEDVLQLLEKQNDDSRSLLSKTLSRRDDMVQR